MPRTPQVLRRAASHVNHLGKNRVPTKQYLGVGKEPLGEGVRKQTPTNQLSNAERKTTPGRPRSAKKTRQAELVGTEESKEEKNGQKSNTDISPRGKQPEPREVKSGNLAEQRLELSARARDRENDLFTQKACEGQARRGGITGSLDIEKKSSGESETECVYGFWGSQYPWGLEFNGGGSKKIQLNGKT